MSVVNEAPEEGASEQEEQVAPNEPESQAADDVAEILVTVHGKQFNVADPVQKAQLEAWDEAHAKFTGRLTNEVGELRRFKKDRTPNESEAELIAKAKAKAQEGDLDAAFESVFGYAKEAISKTQAQLESERVNAELWEEYFVERPELTKKLGRQRIKSIASTLDIYNPEKDPFKVMDDFFAPLHKSSEIPSLGTPKKTDEKPPVSLSGKAQPKATKAAGAAAKPAATLDDVLDAHSIYTRKK